MERPDLIVLKRHRDLEGRRREAWVRRALIGVLAAFVLAGLLNVFGQRESTVRALVPAATLDVRSPSSVRGGLIYQARFVIHARRELKRATLVLDRDWLEGMTLNTLEPSPVGEASRGGDLSLELGHVPAGEQHVLYIQFQVNPTDIGRRTQSVELYDGAELLLTLHRSLAVFP